MYESTSTSTSTKASPSGISSPWSVLRNRVSVPAVHGAYSGSLGFTLIELLVSVSIMAILLAQAVPSMSKYIAISRLRQSANDLFDDLSVARSEALKRNSRVVICQAQDGKTCQSNGGWDHGWIIFQDVNNSGVRDSTEEIIKATIMSKPRVAISGNRNVMRYVSFTALGTTNTLGGGFQAGTFTLCLLSERELESRQVVINSMGRPRIAKASATECQ